MNDKTEDDDIIEVPSPDDVEENESDDFEDDEENSISSDDFNDYMEDEEDNEKVFAEIIAVQNKVYFLEQNGTWFKKTFENENIAEKVKEIFNNE